MSTVQVAKLLSFGMVIFEGWYGFCSHCMGCSQHHILDVNATTPLVITRLDLVLDCATWLVTKIFAVALLLTKCTCLSERM